MLAVLAFLVLSATYAFTAGNTVGASKAGDGSGGITGYAVSAVHYNLNATDPTLVDSIDFDLDSTPIAGSTVKAQLVTGGTWFDCTWTATDVNCVTTGADVASADSLRVVVAD